MDQLVRKGKLKHLLHHSGGQQGQANQEPQRDTSFKPYIGTINVIFATLGMTGSCPSKVMSMARLSAEDCNSKPKRARVDVPSVLSFSEEDKVGTIQPHDDALVTTLLI